MLLFVLKPNMKKELVSIYILFVSCFWLFISLTHLKTVVIVTSRNLEISVC